VGIAVTDVAKGWTAGFAAGETFPQQSVAKIWVALTVLQEVDEGRLRLDQPVTLTSADESVFPQAFERVFRGKRVYQTTIQDLIGRQLDESNNAANDKLLQIAGGPDAVARTLAAKGLAGLAVGGSERDLQARTAGLVWKPEYGLGWTFKAARALLPDAVRDAALDAYLKAPPDGARPAAITDALSQLQRGELLKPATTQVMIGVMSEARTGNRRLRGGLPPGWAIAHKTGTGPDWKSGSVGINDVGLITAPDGHVYAAAVMIRQTKAPIRLRMALMQAVSRAVVQAWSEGQAAQTTQAAEAQRAPAEAAVATETAAASAR
jgi:beta-lactamase class A